MIPDMGAFRVDVEVEDPACPGERRVVRAALVDTGAELSWFPAALLESLGIERRKEWRFRQADGSVLIRWTGGASVYLAGTWTVDEVVFGEPGDLVLVGSRSLEGFNLRVDPVSKRLVDAGPAPAAKVGERLDLTKMQRKKPDPLGFNLERMLAREASAEAGWYRPLREAVDELRARHRAFPPLQ